MSAARRLLGEIAFRLEPRRPGPPGPDFVCVGMAKAGTRWFYDQMLGRPDVWMPPVKEINVLCGIRPASVETKLVDRRRKLHPRGRSLTDVARQRRFLDAYATYAGRDGDLDWYRRLFAMKGARKTGDVSPAYAAMKPERIAHAAAALPETRFVLLMREPADRLWSLLCMQVRAGKLDAALLSDWPRLSDHLARREGRAWYPSRIWRAWSDAVGPDRLRYWFMDDIAGRPDAVVDEMCAHLGIAAGPGHKEAGYNRKRNNPKLPLSPEIRDGLAALMAQERRVCADLFGGAARDWPGA